MTTQASKTIPSIPESSNNVLNQIIRLLAKPDDSLQGGERQRATSLIALSLIFFLLAIITVLAAPIRDAMSGQGFSVPNAGGLIALLVLGVAYGFSRTSHHRIGAYMMVAVPTIAVMVATLSSDTQITDAAMFYISLSIILSSLLLSFKATIISGVLSIGITFILYTSEGVSLEELPVNVLTFMLVTAGVLALASRIREQNLAELVATQAQLELQYKEADEAREKAERSDNVKSSFLASMSHELRTPLNAIINFTRFVVKGVLGPVTEDQVDTLNNVIISGKHLLNLINDVLDMSKIESGSLNLFVTDDVSIPGIIEAVSTTGKALLEDKSVEIKTNVEKDLPLIRGDQQRVHQIFLNLVSNACKFTEEGSITIDARKENSEIVISVADTGAGIAKEDQVNVFEAFKQTTTGLRQGGGTGLGMPITKNLVEAHGGSIKLESTVDEGTTFFVRIPVRSDILTPTLTTES